METSVAIAAPPSIDSASHPSIPHATPIISKDAPVLATIAPQPHRVLARVIKDARHHSGPDNSIRVPSLTGEEESVEITTTMMKTDAPAVESLSSGSLHDEASTVASMDCSNEASTSSSSAVGSCAGMECSGGLKSVSRSVQTDPETSEKDDGQQHEAKIELHSSRDRKSTSSSSRRDIRLPENGISMKRKAVMEAISEILKKMYANTEKGRLPGSFKGRFSSEFTCDSDMREILHSKTTMTSYGSEGDELDSSGSCDSELVGAFGGGRNAAGLSKAKLEENQSLKDKVASLKWKLQHRRAMKIARRSGGWMETLSCEVPGNESKAIERNGYCGMKRGFLLDPYV